jgi:hypothetical protein
MRVVLSPRGAMVSRNLSAQHFKWFQMVSNGFKCARIKNALSIAAFTILYERPERDAL